jgi:hypothetical protein
MRNSAAYFPDQSKFSELEIYGSPMPARAPCKMTGNWPSGSEAAISDI